MLNIVFKITDEHIEYTDQSVCKNEGNIEANIIYEGNIFQLIRNIKWKFKLMEI